MIFDVNFLAIIVCTIFSMILGFIWYTPVLFGNIWMNLIGLKQEDIRPKDAIRGYTFSLIFSFIGCWILSVFLNLMQISGIMNGLLVGFAVGLGFIGFSMYNTDQYEQRSFTLSLINVGYRVVYFTVVGGILAVWK